MINRKILYGYRIRNGILEIVPEEQQTVKRIFTLYNAGTSYQGISDALNQGNIPYSQEVPLWNKHKVKRLLENPRYTGQDDYPAIVDMEVFRAGRQERELVSEGSILSRVCLLHILKSALFPAVMTLFFLL